MHTVVTGSIAFDYIMSFPGRFREHILPDQLDHLSVSFLVDSMRSQRGGCAANIAYNMALLGERPRVMATVGQDFGEYRATLEAHGVDTSTIAAVPDVFTASFFVNTDLEGNQIASFYTGAMAYARDLSILDLAPPPDLVIIAANDPVAMVKYAAECRQLGLPYIYDPSQQIIRLSGEELRAGLQACKILIVNEYEFDMLSNKTGMGLEAVLAECGEALIVTLGSKGSCIYTHSGTYDVPAVPPQAVLDPTGVGDAYRAGLVKGLALGLPWPLTGRLGALAATYTVEQFGPQSHRYTLAEFVARFRAHFDDQGALDVLLDVAAGS